MIEYKKDVTIVKYNDYYYKELERVLMEYSNKYLEEIDLDILIDKLNDFISNIEICTTTISKYRNETESESKSYFGEQFIEQFEQMRKIIEESDCKLLIHGTATTLLDSILHNGLYLRSLDSTTYTCSKNDNYIYSKLLNWQHHGAKGLVLIAVPMECLQPEKRKPILNFNLNKNDNGSPYNQFGYEYILKPEFIIGAIDVAKKEVYKNPLYNRNHDYSTIDIVSTENINPMFMTEEEIENTKKETNANQNKLSNSELDEYVLTSSELLKLNGIELPEKTDNDVFKECINSLNGLFGVRKELKELLFGDVVTLEQWKQEDYDSVLEQLIKIKNKKHKSK